jgi:hypothetical protein
MNVEIGKEAAQFQLRNICFKFSVKCICNTASRRETIGSCIKEKRE